MYFYKHLWGAAHTWQIIHIVQRACVETPTWGHHLLWNIFKRHTSFQIWKLCTNYEKISSTIKKPSWVQRHAEDTALGYKPTTTSTYGSIKCNGQDSCFLLQNNDYVEVTEVFQDTQLLCDLIRFELTEALFNTHANQSHSTLHSPDNT